MNRLPTARELQALKILWRHNRCTVREILVELQSQEPTELAYTTVLSLMQTMERKQLVRREVGGRGKTHHYHAVVESESTLRSLAGRFLDSVFDGAMSQYLVRALESKAPSVAELDELSEMISAARERAEDDG